MVIKKEKMKQRPELRRMFVIMIISAYSFYFSFAGIIPFAGPSLVAYIIGRNKYKNQIHEISKMHFFSSLLISEVVFMIIAYLIYYILSGFYEPKGFWQFIAIALTLNTLSAVIFFYIGDYHAKQRKRRGLIQQLNIY